MILTSNGFFTESIKRDFLGLLSKDKIDRAAVIITTASTQKENNIYAKKSKEDLLSMGFQQVDFLDVEFQDAMLLKQYDVIYISGGNPFYLLHHMRRSGADKIMMEIIAETNTIIIGASAGAVILGPDIEIVNFFTPQMNNLELHDFTGLEVTDVAIFPHYDRDDLFIVESGQTIEERIKSFEQDKQRSITRLKDIDYIII